MSREQAGITTSAFQHTADGSRGRPAQLARTRNENASTTPVIRVAAVGMGWVAQHRHLPVMDRNSRFKVVGVIDRAPGRARDVAARRGYGRFSDAAHLSDVEWLGEVDAVTIATAPMSHHELVTTAVGLGKHVLTEKPFAMSSREGGDMVRAAAAAGKQLAVVHNFQFARSTLRLKADIQSGRLGAITGIDAVQFGNPKRRLPVWYDELPLGLFYDESPHLLYLLQSIAGPIRLGHAQAFPSAKGLATPSRILAWFDASRCSYPIVLSCNFESSVSEWYLLVHGEKHLGIVDVFRDIYIRLPNDGTHATSNVVRTSVTATAQHWLQHFTSGVPHLMGRLTYGNDEVFERFGQAISGEPDRLEPIGPANALAVLELQQAIVARCAAAAAP